MVYQLIAEPKQEQALMIEEYTHAKPVLLEKDFNLMAAPNGWDLIVSSIRKHWLYSLGSNLSGSYYKSIFLNYRVDIIKSFSIKPPLIKSVGHGLKLAILINWNRTLPQDMSVYSSYSSIIRNQILESALLRNIGDRIPDDAIMQLGYSANEEFSRLPFDDVMIQYIEEEDGWQYDLFLPHGMKLVVGVYSDDGLDNVIFVAYHNSEKIFSNTVQLEDLVTSTLSALEKVSSVNV